MLALRSTCGLTDRPVPFSVLEGHRGRPQPLDFGHVPCRNLAGGRGLALPTQSARYGRLVRSAKLSFSVRSPGLQPCLPPFSFEEFHALAPALLAFLTGARRMYHSSRSLGQDLFFLRSEWREWIPYVGIELLGNYLIVTFARFYSSFLSIEPLSLILLVQPSSRTCTINATEIANSIIK